MSATRPSLAILHGITEDQLVLVHDFDRDMIAGLVDKGLAAAQRETIETGGQSFEVVRVMITDAGRKALAG